MSPDPGGIPQDSRTLSALLRQAVETHSVEAQQLDELKSALLDTCQQNLQLHQRAFAALDTMRVELQRMQRRLRILATARA